MDGDGELEKQKEGGAALFRFGYHAQRFVPYEMWLVASTAVATGNTRGNIERQEEWLLWN